MTNLANAYGTTQDQTPDERLDGIATRSFLFVVLHGDQPTLGGARYHLGDVNVIDIGRGSERIGSRVREGDLRKLEIRLPSNTLSKAHGRMVRKGDGWFFEDLGSRNGSFVNGRRVQNALLRDGDFIEVGSVFLRYRAALAASSVSASDLELTTTETNGFATLLPLFADELSALARIARTPITVLLLGESGTGKEVLVSGIHALSERAGPFVAVNCAALPASLLESQLFGHVKGAYTGAIRDELGYLRRAEGGTLFLDEIGDLPLPAQAALLRVLEAREVVPVGATVPIKLDLRIVAATHKSLDRMTLRGEFRLDLLARLQGHQFTLWPLRDRIEDFGILIHDLLRRSPVSSAKELGVSVQAARWLLSQRWLLNIRELSQVLGVAAALADGPLIERSHFPDKNVEMPLPPEEESAENEVDLRGRIVALLEKHKGNVSHVARDMGKARVQIHRWMQKLSIDVNDYRA